jgi:hypothetical protein
MRKRVRIAGRRRPRTMARRPLMSSEVDGIEMPRDPDDEVDYDPAHDGCGEEKPAAE